jgi:hypothetical protein
MIETLFSISGLLYASLLFLIVLLVFLGAFYRPARRTQVSKTKLLALLAVSVFNLAVVLPFTVNFVGPLKVYLLGFWWVVSWLPFVLASLYFFILTVGFIALRKWASFPVTEERHLRSFLLRSAAFEALYAMACPFIAIVGAGILTALGVGTLL